MFQTSAYEALHTVHRGKREKTCLDEPSCIKLQGVLVMKGKHKLNCNILFVKCSSCDGSYGFFMKHNILNSPVSKEMCVNTLVHKLNGV